MKNKTFIVGLIIAALFLGGCSIDIKSKGGGGNDGGVYISPNRGDVWKQMVAVSNISSKQENIGFVNVNNLEIDPSDSSAVYLASEDFGLYYTYNITKGWHEVEKLGDSNIVDLEVDPQEKCTIYAALDNKIMRTQDCSRSWQQIYLVPNQEFTITDIAVDHFNNSHIYIANSAGDL